MSINIYGVTATRVRDDYFPQLAPFGANSPPTSTVVARYIDEAGAELAGRLMQKSISPASITDSSTPQYVWCAQTVTLRVACRVFPVMTGQDPSVLTAMRTELKERLEDLEERGEIALGMDTSGSDSEPDGPTDFISELSLDVGATSDASDAIPALRRSDAL